jgi:hypothetical protein
LDDHVLDRLRIERQSLFTSMASGFARRAFDENAEGVVLDVTLTLQGSSWLAGTVATRSSVTTSSRPGWCSSLRVRPWT